MARQYKTSHRVYTAWNYQKEIEDLNKASEQGWQLIKGGCFSSKFKWNPDVCYRYQIDYPGKVEDMGRYIETFREQGWEYISATFNGWHYFRKAYDAALPDEQYEIFTDRSSLEEMKNRWTKFAISLSVLVAVFTALQLILYFVTPNLPAFIRIVTLGVMLSVCIYGIIKMKNSERRKTARWDRAYFAVFLVVLIAGNAGSILLTESRPYFDANYVSENVETIPAELDRAVEWHTIEIAYSDNYYIDLDITSDSPVCFTIRNESGEIVYTVKGSAVAEEDIKLNLKAGTYTMLLSDFAGGSLNVSLDID
jgi:hypothetical protein